MSTPTLQQIQENLESVSVNFWHYDGPDLDFEDMLRRLWLLQAQLKVQRRLHITAKLLRQESNDTSLPKQQAWRVKHLLKFVFEQTTRGNKRHIQFRKLDCNALKLCALSYRVKDIIEMPDMEFNFLVQNVEDFAQRRNLAEYLYRDEIDKAVYSKLEPEDDDMFKDFMKSHIQFRPVKRKRLEGAQPPLIQDRTRPITTAFPRVSEQLAPGDSPTDNRVLEMVLHKGAQPQDIHNQEHQSEISAGSKRTSISSNGYPSKKQQVQVPPGFSAPKTAQTVEDSTYPVEEQNLHTPRATISNGLNTALAEEQNDTSLPRTTEASRHVSSHIQTQKWMETDKEARLEYVGRKLIANSTDVMQIWRWTTLRAIEFLGNPWSGGLESTDGIFDYYDGIPRTKLDSLPNSGLLRDIKSSRQWNEETRDCLVIGLRKDIQHPDASLCTIFAVTGG